MTNGIIASTLLLSLLATGVMAADPAPQGSIAPPVPAGQASVAKTDDAAPHPDPSKIGTLKIFLGQNAKVDYLGRRFGLDGWLVSKDSAIQVVYTTADGQGTVVGLLYGPDGQVVTGDQLLKAKDNGLSLPNMSGVNPAGDMQQQILPSATASPAAPGESPSERLWKAMEASTYLTFGPASAPPLYVFMDPRCHYCHDYYQSLTSTFLPKNTFQLRVVPVGILGPDSLKEAQQILSAPDPKAAWDKLETGDRSGLPETIASGVDTKVGSNNSLMGQWNLKGTPGTVYRGKDGKVKLVYGLPSDTQAMVADVAEK